MPNLIQMAGGQPEKPTRFVPIYVDREFTGLYTQRNPLRDPSDTIRAKFYGGRPDALLGGTNVELTNRLTLARRPGLSAFSTTTYPNAPDYFYSFQKINGGIDVIVDTSASIYLDNQNGTKTLIFNKGAGAAQSQFQGIGSTLYIGDGVDLQKWNDFGTGVPGNNNGNLTNPSWNWGITAPTAPPSVAIQPAASSGLPWQPLTVFTTMGMLDDGLGNLQFLIGINAKGTNTNPNFGTSAAGAPAWNQAAGGTTTESSGTPITWTNRGQIVPWAPNTTFENFSVVTPSGVPEFCYDPVTGGVFGNANPGLASGTTGATRPPFVNTPTTITHDGGVKWACVNPKPGPWIPGHVYSAYAASTGINSTIVEPYALPPITGQPLYIQSAGAGGTSGTGGTPTFSSTVGMLAFDGDLKWYSLGPSTRLNNHAYTAFAPGQLPFSAIELGGNVFVCITSGTSAGSAPTFATNYGDQTADGTAVWSCVGPPLTWAASTIWNLPLQGFAPPTSAQPYGGSAVVDNLSPVHLQFVISSGKSQSPGPPTWNATQGGPTTDGGITWRNVAVFAPSALAWTKGHVYAYSFTARLASDIYNTTSPPGEVNQQPIPPLGPPTGSASGGISTASPVFTITGANTGAVNTVSGVGSLDPQVDTITIWRDADGGGSDKMFFLSEIAAPAPIGNSPGIWNFEDNIPDLPTGTTPGLNELIAAPIDHSNDPPLPGFLPDDYHFGRIWGHIGETVFFSGGPDTLTGNGNESFPPANSFQFPSQVTRSVSTPTGLLVFTVDNIFLIAGGPLLATFYDQPLIKGTGLLSFNALDIQGNTIFVFTSDRQLVSIDPSAGESEIGFAIGDQLSLINPASAYVTAHIAGSQDKAIYVADGSTGWYRLNPNQAPEGGGVWSVKANITGGCKAVQSIETTPGVHQLLVGSTTGGNEILKRDLTVFSDSGTPYASNLTMGCIVLAQPGQLAELGFITLDSGRTGTAPAPSYLLDEISGTFTAFGVANVSDPPELWGAAGHPTSLFSDRFYFNASIAGGGVPPPAWCRFLQIEIDFGATDTVQNELLTLTIFGAHYQEK